MEILKFKTNIKCTGCTSKVTPFLNEAVGADNWEVDLESMNKVLTVTNEDTDADSVKRAVEAAGYTAERIA